jgi:hypothetical protein
MFNALIQRDPFDCVCRARRQARLTLAKVLEKNWPTPPASVRPHFFHTFAAVIVVSALV